MGYKQRKEVLLKSHGMGGVEALILVTTIRQNVDQNAIGPAKFNFIKGSFLNGE